MEEFRNKVQEYRRPVGQSQKALANRLGLHPTVLSHKLNGTGNIILTHSEIKALIKILAEWEAISQQNEAIELLELAGLKVSSFSNDEWNTAPLNLLEKTGPALYAKITASATTTPTDKTRLGLPHHLPTQATPLIGRTAQIEQLKEMLTQAHIRLLTLTGPGGTGKTRLALQVAAEIYQDFQDNVFFVPLATTTDETQVIAAITQALEIKESLAKGRPRAALENLKEYLAPRQMLLILDNFEQVLNARNLVATLLEVAPRLKLLITSRIALQLYGEYEFAVPTLTLPVSINPLQLALPSQIAQYEAVELFVQRTKAVRHNFELNEGNALAVVEICSRLDGLPLAIELAAARSRLFTPQIMLTQLAAGSNGTGAALDFLSRGANNLPARQQTLRNTIEWSYTLLDASEKHLFQHLAIFVGGFGVKAVEIVSGRADALDTLEALLAKSMLVQLESATEGELRFMLLETIREYALEKLAMEGPEFVTAVRQRHLDYFVTLAETAEQELSGLEQLNWLKQLENDHANARAALNWALQVQESSPGTDDRLALALRLTGALGLFWEITGHMSEGRKWLEQVLSSANSLNQTNVYAKALVVAGALALTQSDASAARGYYELSIEISRNLNNMPLLAQAFSRLGQIARMQGDYTEARNLGEQSLVWRRALNDQNGIARSLVSLAVTARYTGDFLAAQQLYEESLVISRELGDKRMVALTLNNLGEAFRYQGQLERSIECQAEALRMRREVGDKSGVASSLMNLGASAFTKGDFLAAQTLLQESISLYRQLNYRYGLVYALTGLGETICSQGDYAAARLILEEALQIGQAIGDQTLVAMTINSLAISAIGLDEVALGCRLAEQSLSLRRRVGDKFKIAETLLTLGQANLLQHNYGASKINFQEALQVFHSLNTLDGVASCLVGIAGTALAEKQAHLATLWLSAATLLTANKVSQSVRETFFFEKHLELARCEMNPAIFEELWLKGQTLELSEIVKQALEY